MIYYYIFTLLGYLIGSFPTGVVLTRKKYGLDVREMGSGNIGATNVTRVFGWYAGILVFVIDFLKGYIPLFILKSYFSTTPWLLTFMAGGLVMGHCFSIFLKLRGGKGVATSFGCIAFVSPWCAFTAALTYVFLLVVTKISAVGSLGAILAALIYLEFSYQDQYISYLVVGISFVVFIKHRDNILRLVERVKKRKKAKL